MIGKKATLKRTDSANPDFVKLVRRLDQYLAIRNGEAIDFFARYNKIELITHVVVVYTEGQPVGCGAMKPFSEREMEIKRMFVLPEYRGQGFAQKVLSELENWARELNYRACVLETGKDMVDAVVLYQKSGYHVIPNYGQYAQVENSVCMRKEL